MREKCRNRLSAASKIALWSMLASGVVAAVLLLPPTGGVYYVFNHYGFGIAAAMLFFVAVSVLLITLFRRINRRYGRVLIVMGIVFAFCIVFVLGWAQTFLSILSNEYRIEVSPSGKHRLVIIENGFIDALYHSYPMINDWMYREQDNGSISYHDFWGDVTAPNVVWVSETEAHVTLDVDFYPNKGSSDSIIVRFEF